MYIDLSVHIQKEYWYSVNTNGIQNRPTQDAGSDSPDSFPSPITLSTPRAISSTNLISASASASLNSVIFFAAAFFAAFFASFRLLHEHVRVKKSMSPSNASSAMKDALRAANWVEESSALARIMSWHTTKTLPCQLMGSEAMTALLTIACDNARILGVRLLNDFEFLTTSRLEKFKQDFSRMVR